MDLTTFLEEVTLNLLREAQETHPFIIVGTRAINAYLSESSMKTIPTQDWDVAYIGDQEGQDEFAHDIKQAISRLGYKAKIEYHTPIKESDHDTFAFRSRHWIRLSVNIGGEANVTFLDIYRIPQLDIETGMFVEKNGLLYSDLGFLFRELNRAEDDTNRLVNISSNLSNEEIKSRLKKSKELLEETSVELGILDDDSDELIESVGQVSDDSVKRIAAEHLEQLEKAKHTLMRVTKEREALFGVVMSGRVSKSLSDEVCSICRVLELQYGQYKDLKQRCESIRELCHVKSRSAAKAAGF